LPFQAGHVVDLEVAVLEEEDVRGVLSRDAFADGAVANVVVYRTGVRVSMNMIASTGIFMGHGSLPSFSLR
jgi:hypothetical protein